MNTSMDFDVISEQVQRSGFSKIAKIKNYNYSCMAVPSTREYLTAISWYGILLVSYGVIALLLTLFMFVDTLRYIINYSPPRVKTLSAFVIGVYPIIAIATLCATIVPRSQLIAEAVTQGIFMVGLYQLFCLFVSYCGGEAELIKKVNPPSLITKAAPCCCWPCCCCLPTLDVNKKRLLYLRILVLQLPIVQGLVYMTLLVLWAERESLYEINYVYVQPLIVASIFIGVWGMSMTTQLLRDCLKGYWMNSKFIVLQLVLMLSKLQGLLIKALVWTDVLPCNPPLTSNVYSNLIYNCLILWQMALLAYIARNVYKKALPNDEFHEISTHNPSVQIIASISNSIHTQEQINGNNNIAHVPNKNIPTTNSEIAIIESAEQEKYKDKGQEIQENQFEQMTKQMEVFKVNLEEFAVKHKNEIRKNSHFRKQFQDMCAAIGVDPLASGKGFWSVLGIGDFYYELAVQIVEVCLATTYKNGGLISLSELRTRLIKARGQGKQHQDISQDDLLCAAQKLKILGSGFSVVPVGKGQYMVQSVPGELTMDHTAVIEQAANSNKAFTSISILKEHLKWEDTRAEKALNYLLEEGLLWLDAQDPHERLYYFPSLFTACINE
ncbi:hypothetical protein FQA39_LY04442 [Lamprigera yunnana]|nr:hypothetical protein FQA39_LY04442 [Lamprigera yunnana]